MVLFEASIWASVLFERKWALTAPLPASSESA
jgi:hypothetical protein